MVSVIVTKDDDKDKSVEPRSNGCLLTKNFICYRQISVIANKRNKKYCLCAIGGFLLLLNPLKRVVTVHQVEAHMRGRVKESF